MLKLVLESSAYLNLFLLFLSLVPSSTLAAPVQNERQNNICVFFVVVCIVFKAKAEKNKIQKKNFTPQKALLWVLKQKPFKKNISSYFSFILALKTIDAKMLFWSVF